MQGFNTGIDFTGGSILQLTFDNKVDVADLRETVSDMVEHTPLIQESEGSNTFNIRTDLTTDEDVNGLLAAIESSHGSYSIDRNELVGPTIGKELTLNAFFGIGHCLCFDVGIHIHSLSTPFWNCLHHYTGSRCADFTFGFTIFPIRGFQLFLLRQF